MTLTTSLKSANLILTHTFFLVLTNLNGQTNFCHYYSCKNKKKQAHSNIVLQKIK